MNRVTQSHTTKIPPRDTAVPTSYLVFAQAPRALPTSDLVLLRKFDHYIDALLKESDDFHQIGNNHHAAARAMDLVHKALRFATDLRVQASMYHLPACPMRILLSFTLHEDRVPWALATLRGLLPEDAASLVRETATRRTDSKTEFGVILTADTLDDHQAYPLLSLVLTLNSTAVAYQMIAAAPA